MRADYVATASQLRDHNYRQITRHLIPISSFLDKISHLQTIVEPIRQKNHSIYIFYLYYIKFSKNILGT